MQDRDKAAFAAIMSGLADNYGQTVTAQGAALRFVALRQYSLGDVQRAAMSLMVSRKYTTMPTVADFVEHLGGGSAEDKAEVEAGKVLDAVGRVGGYRSVAFDDAVTQAVIVHVFGGWTTLCAELSLKDRQWWRKEFARAYAAYTRQGVQQVGHLPGIVETHNAARGVAHDEPLALVGHQDRAAAIAADTEPDSGMVARYLPQDGGALPTGRQGAGSNGASFGMSMRLPYDKTQRMAQ